MKKAIKFASLVFWVAAIYGIIGSLSLYFTDVPLAERIYIYGFAGLAVTFQLIFVMIARDSKRYQALMPIGIVEKLSFAIPAMGLGAMGAIPQSWIVMGAIDLLFAIVFLVAWRTMVRAS